MLLSNFNDFITLLYGIEACSCGSSDDNAGVIIALATVMVIAIIGLVISIVINVCFVVQSKQSRYVVTSIHSM